MVSVKIAIDEPVLVDTGPLVAYLNQRDVEHDACARVFDQLPLGKSFTCWPVLTEAAYLIRTRLGLSNPHPLLDLIRGDELDLSIIGRSDIDAIIDVYSRYHDLQVDLADAALLAIAERDDLITVFTTDRRDFRVYRRLDGRPFRLLPDDFE